MKKVLAILLALVLVLAFSVPVIAGEPTPPQEIPTEGEVDPNDPLNYPVIKAKWELPDDADPMPEHGTLGTQVQPVPCTDKIVEFYMVARDPNGADDIANAGFRIVHPTGPPEAWGCWTKDLTELDPRWGYGMVQNLKVSEMTAGEWVWPAAQADIEDAIARAVAANLLTQVQADELLEELSEWEARFFCATKPFTCCYAPGVYNVTAWASDTAGGQGELVNELYYESLIAIDLDFDAGINYGNLVPGVKQILSGDEDMGTPGMPTVQSLGNDPIQICMNATAMVGVNKADEIKNFDARLDHFAPIDFVASEDVMVPGVLIPNWIEKMDFSVTAPLATPADIYKGTMTLWIQPYVCP